MKKHLLPLFLIAAVAIILAWPLFKPGLWVMHDDQQVARLFLFDQSLRAGQFPVRWVDGLGFGFGYPLFVFYPPLVYFVGEAFHLIGFGFIDSVKLVFFASIVASGVAMYILLKSLWGRLPGLVGALFYLAVPYRAIDIYIRGAMAESFSFVWPPLILWSFYQLSLTARPLHIYLSGIFLALLMLTHNLIFLPFMLILPFYLLFLFVKYGAKKKFFVNCLVSIVIGLAISSFFWLPAIWEKKFTIVDDLLLINLANYNIHFVYPQQLWNWPWGFGGSAEGLADGLSFKIGKLHILASLAAFLLASTGILYRKYKSQLPAPSLASGGVNCSPRFAPASTRVAGEAGQLSTVFFLLFLLSAFMTTYYSKPVWDLVPPLAYLQFPWRFLTFTALFSSILAAAFIFLLKVPIIRLVAASLVIFLLIFNLKLFAPQTYRPDLTDHAATAKEVINWDISHSSFEYIPRGVELTKSSLGTNLIAISKSDIPREKVTPIKGSTQVTYRQIKPHLLEFTVDAQEDTKLQANIFNFPGWQAQIDNQEVPINDNNRLKLITLNVTKGEHSVLIEFKNTSARSIGNWITLGAAIAMGITVAIGFKFPPSFWGRTK